MSWQDQAWALLDPTPLGWVDPGGEAGRLDELTRRLGLAEPDAPTRALIVRCSQDAFDAEFGLPLGPGDPGVRQPARLDPLRLVHPLSAQALKQEFATDAAALAAWPDFLALLPAAPLDARALRRVWWTLAAHRLGTGLPADPRMPDVPSWAQRSLTAALVGCREDGDEPALLYLHLGPVQRFIEAARRTHDLWIASYTLAYLVFQAIRPLVAARGPQAILSPCLTELPLARHFLLEEQVSDRSSLLAAAIPNKVLALVPGRLAAKLAEQALSAVRARWVEFGEAVQQALPGIDPVQHLGASVDQLREHLELDVLVQPWPAERTVLAGYLERLGVPHASQPGGPERTGDLYGPLFYATHGLLAAHREGNFPPPRSGDSRPKCTCCGLREQMGPVSAAQTQLRESKEFWDQLSRTMQDPQGNGQPRHSLHLEEGEGLCMVCLTKRLAPQHCYGAPVAELGLTWDGDRPLLRFPSTYSIAAAPWRQRLLKAIEEDPADDADRAQARGELKERLEDWTRRLDEIHRQTLKFDPPGNTLPGLGPLGIGDTPLLHFDGAWLYEEAYEPERCRRDHGGLTEELGESLPEALGAFRRVRRALGKLDPRAANTPYFAVLALDGDHLGQWLTGSHERSPTYREVSGLPSRALGAVADQPRPVFPARHAELSRRLARLASTTLPEIVNRHLGRVVYSGGDDLLALLPLGTALSCAREIERAVRSTDALGERVTLSAGLAVWHARMPLGRALEEARAAEGRAKGPRNSCCLRFFPRSGAMLELCLPWHAAGVEPLDLLERPGPAEDEEGLSPSLAQQLRAEVGTLEREQVPPKAFLCRLETLLGRQASDRVADPLFEALAGVFRHLLQEAPRAPGVSPHEQLVRLLLAARFLAKEGGAARPPEDRDAH